MSARTAAVRLLPRSSPTCRHLSSSSRTQAASVTASDSISASNSVTAASSAAANVTPASIATPGKARIVSSLILSRPPVILRQPTKFEQAYFDYNRQLSEALQQPFPKEFYFKKGSAAEKRFEEDQASTPSGFQAIAEASKSASRTGKQKGSAKDANAASASSNTPRPSEGEAEAQPLPRTTDADASNDVTSLQRKLDRTLYLVVKQKAASPSWSFPSKPLTANTKENLHHVAPTSVTDLLGQNLDIWMVSNLPVALYRSAPDEKTYFMRGHVLAGNAELAKDQSQIDSFQWLTKEEIETLMKGNDTSSYWQTVQDLLDP
ncbi:hypothetical protein BCV70DRAFT_207244 [Testicularia cyperi]|uniref:Large ribosomal subunit protein mL46 n=1 Tax=Testicularia cyperi TaxID=1882483 RepID=A0A317XMC4_9BASI|nr:hypothetical protein BCV70DRAFT_207244 [Testicularia cyperi]